MKVVKMCEQAYDRSTIKKHKYKMFGIKSPPFFRNLSITEHSSTIS